MKEKTYICIDSKQNISQGVSVKDAYEAYHEEYNSESLSELTFYECKEIQVELTIKEN